MDTSTGHPVVVNIGGETIANLRDVAVTPGGDKIVTASRARAEFDERRLSPVTRDGVVYPGVLARDSVAISPVHDGLIATGIPGSKGDVIAEYELGNGKAVVTMLDTGIDHNLLYPRGLAFSRDGELIFAVTGLAADSTAPVVTLPVVTLNVLADPLLP